MCLFKANMVKNENSDSGQSTTYFSVEDVF